MKHHRAPDAGTALAQCLPWVRALGAVADAARAFLAGTGGRMDLVRALKAYDDATKAIEKEA